MRAQHRLVLTDAHLSATDADTVLSPGVVDPAKITFRISAITGGKLQSLSSSDVWEDMGLATGAAYYAFTFADLQAGKVAFLAGDGLQSGDGERIAFKVQAVDDDGNLSDSDVTPGDQPADGTIAVDRAAVAVTAGVDRLINTDDVLTPDAATLGLWKGAASGRSGTLHVVVRLGNKQDGDILSLGTGYDANKFTPGAWNAGTGELPLQIASGATEADIQAALKLLELRAELSLSSSTRKVWVFPILSGVGEFAYRVDETAGLVRYYFYDTTTRSFSDATTEASKRILFGKHGYLGVFTSDTGRDIYNTLVPFDVYLRLAISDSATEGKWLVTDGPRKGQLFWDNTNNQFGPGAAGSSWNAQDDFWLSGELDNLNDQDYGRLHNDQAKDVDDYSRRSISHHDLLLEEGKIFVRLVEVAELHPILSWKSISASCVRVPSSLWC